MAQGFNPEKAAVSLIREKIEKPVRPFAHVADAPDKAAEQGLFLPSRYRRRERSGERSREEGIRQRDFPAKPGTHRPDRR